MVTFRHAQIRHAEYYLKLAQSNETDLVALFALEKGNLTKAADTFLQYEHWPQLTDITNAINDFWITRGEWADYIRFNGSLVTHDLENQNDERVARIVQLVDVAEIQARYDDAVSWGKFLRGLPSEIPNRLAIVKALTKIARLSAAKGNASESLHFLEEALLIARQIGSVKEEVDIFFEIAVYHKNASDTAKAGAVCNSALDLARSIGYTLKEIDILSLTASLYVVNSDLERALELNQHTLRRVREMGDSVREGRILLEIMSIEDRINSEKNRNRKIFISYNGEDRQFVAQLAGDLKDRGLPVWWDDWEIKVGDSITQKVSEGIYESAYLAVVLSPMSVKSAWVKREVGSALMQQLSVEKSITILPVLLADCEVPVLLRDLKRADFRQSYQEGLQSLLATLSPEDAGPKGL